MILHAMEDRALPVYGDGLNVRDWIHVEDHCDAVARVLDAGREGEVYNIGGRAERANLDIVRAILRQLGKPESLIRYVTDRPGHDQRYAIDDRKIERELGWVCARRLDEGLAETVRWYREHTKWVGEVRSGDYRTWYERNYAARGGGMKRVVVLGAGGLLGRYLVSALRRAELVVGAYDRAACDITDREALARTLAGAGGVDQLRGVHQCRQVGGRRRRGDGAPTRSVPRRSDGQPSGGCARDPHLDRLRLRRAQAHAVRRARRAESAVGLCALEVGRRAAFPARRADRRGRAGASALRPGRRQLRVEARRAPARRKAALARRRAPGAADLCRCRRAPARAPHRQRCHRAVPPELPWRDDLGRRTRGAWR